jgi:DNA-binding response OmpR family regulator
MYKRSSNIQPHKKHILIIEDDETLSYFLKEDLEQNDYRVNLLHDGEPIPKLMSQHCIHLVLLDIMLPNKNGIYWLKWIKQYYAHTPVIIISAKTTPEDRLIGLEAGACDYLTKPFHTNEVTLKVKRLLGRVTQASSSKTIKIGHVSINIEDEYVDHKNNKIPLTKLECKILQLFYLNAGIPLSRDEIMQQSMGMEYLPTNRSIDIHINRLRNKIEKIPNKPQYIRTIRGRGYYLHLP